MGVFFLQQPLIKMYELEVKFGALTTDRIHKKVKDEETIMAKHVAIYCNRHEVDATFRNL